MACTHSDVSDLTGRTILISDSAAAKDYTQAQVTDRILRVVRSKVMPAFRKAGYAVPYDYPTTEFSTHPPATSANQATAENAMITEMIARGVACSLAKGVQRYNQPSRAGVVVYSQPPAVKGWCAEFEQWLKDVASGEIIFEGIAADAGYTQTPVVDDTGEDLFNKMDNASDDDLREKDSDDWGFGRD